MAGLRGNQAWLMFQKQTAKGTPAVVSATNAYKVPFSGGSIAPVRSIDQLAETDASRDQGVSFARSGGVEGTPSATSATPPSARCCSTRSARTP
jgi:hypothetical protein